MSEQNPYLLSSRKRRLDEAILYGVAPLTDITETLTGAYLDRATGQHSDGGVYLQERIGLHGEPFIMKKLRTMTGDDESQDVMFRQVQSRVPNTTVVAIRAIGLDELPQFDNIEDGTMSLVGPRATRPLNRQFLEVEHPDLYPEWEDHVNQAKPGILCLSTALRFTDPDYYSADGARRVMEQDIRYVKEASLGMDMKIITTCMAYMSRRALKRVGVIPPQRVQPVFTSQDAHESQRV